MDIASLPHGEFVTCLASTPFISALAQLPLQDLQVLQQQLQDAARAAEQQQAQALAGAKADAEESITRHLAFIDRLMADKEELTRQLFALNDALKVRCSRAALPALPPLCCWC